MESEGGIFDFPIMATDMDIQENYQKIIWQSKCIFETEKEQGEGLIKL